MINPETSSNLGTNKLQSTVTTKKTALRDLPNKNGNYQLNNQDVRRNDAVKICGTKRLTPEHPSNSPSHSQLLNNNDVNQQIVNARRRFDLELGPGRSYTSMDKFIDGSKSKQNEKSKNPRIPVTTSNNGNKSQTVNTNKVTQPSRSIISESIDERKRTERFIRLQDFLKQCDESYPKDYTQMLLRVSPPELSGHAVELEKRVIQLIIEERNELQRMKIMNILEKPGPPSVSLQTNQLHQSRN